MIRARKVAAVLSFEFLSTVKRKGYLIATLGMPLFVLLYAGVIGIGVRAVSKKEQEIRTFGVVDNAQVLQLTGDTSSRQLALPESAKRALEITGTREEVERSLASGNAVFRPFADERAAKSALDAQQVKGYYVIPPDYLTTGKVDGYLREGALFDLKGGSRELGDLLSERLLAGRVPDDVAALVKNPIRGGRQFMVAPGGEPAEKSTGEVAMKFGVPIGLAFLLMVSLQMSAGYLLQAVAVEKENRVMEVLLSSASPDEILTGKLIALGAAGLIQIVAWFSVAVAAALFTATALAIAGVVVPWTAMVLGLVYFVLGYLLIGSLMIGTASLGSTMREIQQLSMVWIMVTVVPLILFNALMADPHGVLARTLTYIPFTTALTMILRLAFEPTGVLWWEIPLSILEMGAAIYVAINIGARLFRVGVLLTGVRPKMRQILRQAGLLPGRA